MRSGNRAATHHLRKRRYGNSQDCVVPWRVMFQRPGPYVEVHHGGHPWVGLLCFLLLLAALAFAALTFWRTSRQPVHVVAPPPPPAPATPRDPALAELRLRYARGEIDRDEYLQRATDLGDVVPVAPAPPPAQPDGDT
jgi:putative membrane protein